MTPPDPDFQEAYLSTREKEGRVYDDEEARRLPYASLRNPHRGEWKLRTRSMKRLFHYLDRRIRSGRVLDLGCGNGWLAGRLANLYDVLGLDINLHELEQAARLFQSASCRFACGDVFRADLPQAYFSVIVLNSSVQYFPSLSELVGRLQGLLEEDGEIHILDSPIYSLSQIDSARMRTEVYYRQNGMAAMLPYYFHHSYGALKGIPHSLLYRPDTILGRMRRKFWQSDSPFPWIRIRKDRDFRVSPTRFSPDST